METFLAILWGGSVIVADAPMDAYVGGGRHALGDPALRSLLIDPGTWFGGGVRARAAIRSYRLARIQHQWCTHRTRGLHSIPFRGWLRRCLQLPIRLHSNAV